MATLQTLQHRSAFIAKSRLKQVVGDRPEVRPPAPEAPTHAQNVVETVAAPFSAAPTASAERGTLTKLERRQLLLQTIIIYEHWQLASVHHRPQSDILVAYLIRKNEQSDPNTAIREGRALQIVMDSFGNLTIQHPNRHWPSWLRKMGAAFGLKA